jgi:predicted lactoylglutathione lyase
MISMLKTICIGGLFYTFQVALFAQEFQFQREVNTIPVILNNGVVSESAFAGGFSISKPEFADIDNDGDFDLFVGVDGRSSTGPVGRIRFYRNTGTATSANFMLEMENFAGIDVGGARVVPTFADIDSDGDLDLFVVEGGLGRKIVLYRNIGTATNPDFTLETENFASIDVGDGIVPVFADIDNDGDFDLFVAEFVGNINFYRNTGTPTDPSFTLETENFASVNVTVDVTKSVPTFVDIDDDGDLDLFVGLGGLFGDTGRIHFYRNIGTATNPDFTLETKNFASIDVGSESVPVFADIDNDGDFDLFVGADSGNLHFYQNIGTATNPAFTIVTETFATIDLEWRSAPTFVDIDNDRDFDLFVGEYNGNINFFRNTGTATNPTFTLETQNFASIDVGIDSRPIFSDIDNDGDQDLFVGELSGNINFYRNTGTANNPNFTLETANFASIDVGDNSTPVFADIDNDGDFDLFVGVGGTTATGGNIHFYQNIGTATNPDFTLETKNFASIDVGSESVPVFADIDHDGDFDLFVGGFRIHFYRNIGTTTNPAFTLETKAFASIIGDFIAPTFVDIDDDSDFDLFLGEVEGGLFFYRNVAPVSVTSPEIDGVPKSFDLSQNYPNPFNPGTTIQYQLPKISQVKLSIYNILGQWIVTLVNKRQQAGFYSVNWDGKDDRRLNVASGIYLYRLETEEFVKVRKLSLVR